MSETAPATTRCAYKTDKGRQCLLSDGHETVKGTASGHKMMNRSTSPKPVLPAGLKIVAEAVKPSEVIKKASNRSAEPRDADQKERDTDAAKNYAENKRRKTTTLTPFQDLAISRYVVPKTAYDAIIYMIRRAAQSGGPLPYDGSVRLRYRQQANPKGHTEIQWAFVDYAEPPAAS